MKKSSFVAMVLGAISLVFFSLGMCMALLPEWNAFTEGVIFGAIGLVLGLVTLRSGAGWSTKRRCTSTLPAKRR